MSAESRNIIKQVHWQRGTSAWPRQSSVCAMFASEYGRGRVTSSNLNLEALALTYRAC